jgi:hypothetical protein
VQSDIAEPVVAAVISDSHPRLNERAQRTKQLIDKTRNLDRGKTLHDMLLN